MAFKRIVKDAENRAVGRPYDLGAAKLVKEEAEELEHGVRHCSVLHPPVPVPPHNPPDLLPNLVLEGTVWCIKNSSKPSITFAKSLGTGQG